MGRSKLRTNPFQLGTNAWSVEEHYVVPAASFQSEMAALWARIPSVTGIPASGRFAPRAVGMPTAWHYYGNGKHRIIAQYRTLSNDEYMERYPPKGIVLGKSAIRMERIKYDKNGVLVNGVDPTDPTGRTVYKIVAGPETVRRNLMMYRIHAIVASKSIWIDQYTDKLGMVNSSWMGNLSRWGSNKRELLFSGLSFAPLPYDKSKFVVDYDFLWDGQKGVEWNKLSISRMFKWKIAQTPRINSAGEDEGTRDIITKVPTDTWAYAPMYAEKNFSMVNNLCNW